MNLEPLRATSLKDEFITRFEELILSGQVSIGSRLPSERALALQLGVSRPVVHEGLAELAARGLVTQTPRVGTVVNDYRREGSLALLTSLFGHPGAFDPALLDDLLALRQLVEVEGARVAAFHRGDGDLAELAELLAREEQADRTDPAALVALDFAFHHRVALASGNALYPMLLKSCEPAHANLALRFFARPAVLPVVLAGHRAILAAIAARHADAAGAAMQELLDHGRRILADALAAEE